MFSFTNLSFDNQLTDEEKFIISLNEMSTVGRSHKYKLLLQVHPSENRTGDSYFKVYDSSNHANSKKVNRIRFEYPLYVVHSANFNEGKELWWMNSKEKKRLIEFLNDQCEDDPRFNNWQYSILQFNKEKGISFNQTRKNLINGNRKLPYPNFLPFNLPIPDYSQLPKNEKINEQKKQQIERNQ